MFALFASATCHHVDRAELVAVGLHQHQFGRRLESIQHAMQDTISMADSHEAEGNITLM